MGERFDATTEHLRDAAYQLLTDRGARALSLEALAKSAYLSIGSVYERWRSPQQVIEDVARTRALPMLDLVASRSVGGEDPFTLLLEDEPGNHALRCVVEVLFAARDHVELRTQAQEALHRLEAALTGDERSPLDPDVAPYATVVIIGLGLLRTGGCRVTPMTGTLADLTARPSPGGVPATSGAPFTPPPLAITIPPLGVVAEADQIGGELRESARLLLAGPDRRNATVRAIASDAGVTTGALYRRFRSASDLLVDILMAELQSDRYAWMTDLLQALESPDPLDASAQVMSHALSMAVADSPTNTMLLEVTVAARTDAAVRGRIVEQIEAVTDARVALFAHLADSGVTRPDLDPAALAWLLQAAPIGGRLIGATGLLPDEAALTRGIRHLAERSLA